MTIKQMKSKLAKLQKRAKKLDKVIFDLDCKLWDAMQKTIKPEEMCRRRWTAGYECAQKKGHDRGPNATTCQGQAPPYPEPQPKYRKNRYQWLPRGVDFTESGLPANFAGVVPCEYCGWPVSEYENSWFHIVGRFGEEPKGCDWAAPNRLSKKAAA